MKTKPSRFPYLVCVSLILMLFAFAGCQKTEIISEQSTQVEGFRQFASNMHIITESEAAAYTARFQAAFPIMYTKAFWTKHAVNKLLAQPQVENVRYYFGRSPDNLQELILVAADENDNDIISGDLIKATTALALRPYSENQLTNNNIDWHMPQMTNLTAAAASTAAHRAAMPGVSLAGMFSKAAIKLLTTQPGTFGILAEYGMTEDYHWVVILRSLDKDGHVIPGMIIERGFRCPPACGSSNVLNGY